MLDGIEAISFDLDDTLWECEPAIVHAEGVLHQWFEDHTPRIAEAHTNESLLAHRLAYYQRRPELAGDVTLMRTLSLEQLMDDHGYDTALAQQAFATFYKARSEVVLYDGVVPMLDRLSKHYKIAAITNGNADLELIGIAHHFDDIQRASIDNAAKPATDMFDACLAKLGLPASRLAHVGDSPQTDVGGAHNAGVTAIWFNQRAGAWLADLPQPQFEVGSIAALEHLLVNTKEKSS